MLRLFSLALFLPCSLSAQTICQIQGTGAASAYDGQQVTTEGVVTALYTGSGSLGGYFIEQPGCDGNANSSNGVFVYDPTPGGIAVGQRVSVTATVDEYNGVTELINASHQILGTGTVIATEITLPVEEGFNWEPYEGMFLRFPGSLTIADNTGWVQYGQVYLAPQRQITPTNLVDPNDAVAIGTNTAGVNNAAAVNAQQQVIDRSYILLDDGRTNTYPTPLPWADANGTLRTGSIITDVQGVLHYAFGEYRLEPVGSIQLQHQARPVVPLVGGTVRAASLNVLNYFTTLGGWGAANPAELARQRTKLVSAMQTLDADVYALCELENSDLAWNDLLTGLNSAVGSGTYAGMEQDGFGNGTRTVIFYRTTALTPVTELFWLGTNIFQRPHLTQGFELNSSGGRFLISTMHLRSKICDNADGADLDQGDGQGCYNDLRRAQANALVQHWAGIRNSTGIEAQLILGDYNAYTEEDPIDVLRAAGLERLLDPNEYTHSYNGTFGALDHAFATSAMAEVVTEAAVWHINTDEPEALDYSDENLTRYQPNAFRCSDHDPLLVGFEGADLNVETPEMAAQNGVQVILNDGRALWSLEQATHSTLALKLFDARGTLVLERRMTGRDLYADLSSLASGVHLWRITTSVGHAVGAGRFVIP